MAKGKTRSKLSRSERLAKAFEFYGKGLDVAEVSRRLRVSWDTAKRYKEKWEASIDAEAQEKPELLRDVVRNTVQAIRELDMVRAEAWKTYHTADSKQTKLQALNTIRSCQTDKAKLFGLFGVKQDFFLYVQSVNIVQSRLLEFMAEKLCDADRDALAALLEGELAPYLPNTSSMPVLELSEGDDDVEDAVLVG